MLINAFPVRVSQSTLENVEKQGNNVSNSNPCFLNLDIQETLFSSPVMFSECKQTKNHCFPAMLRDGGKIRKHYFSSHVSSGSQTMKHCLLAKVE